MAENKEKGVDLPWGKRGLYSRDDRGSINEWVRGGGVEKKGEAAEASS